MFLRSFVGSCLLQSCCYFFQVLSPRVKAFDCCLNSLQSYIDAVYDITIIYDTREPGYDGKMKTQPILISLLNYLFTGYRPQAPHAVKFLLGHCKKVYIKFDRIPIQDVLNQISACDDGTTTDQASASMKWLHGRFGIKDQILEKFFSKGRNRS